ncbi:TPA: hypothetical protein U0K61_002157, partial [Streptococcus suis]|nr:hypothetical protein [Streptococcus suis]
PWTFNISETGEPNKATYFYLKLVQSFLTAIRETKIDLSQTENSTYFSQYYTCLFIVNDNEVASVIDDYNQYQKSERFTNLIENLMLKIGIYKEQDEIKHSDFFDLVKKITSNDYSEDGQKIVETFKNLASEIRLRNILKQLTYDSWYRYEGLEEAFLKRLNKNATNQDEMFNENNIQQVIAQWPDENQQRNLKREYDLDKDWASYLVSKQNFLILEECPPNLKNDNDWEDYINKVASRHKPYIPSETAEKYDTFKKQLSDFSNNTEQEVLEVILFFFNMEKEQAEQINKTLESIEETKNSINQIQMKDKEVIDLLKEEIALLQESPLASQFNRVDTSSNQYFPKNLLKIFNHSKKKSSNYLDITLINILEREDSYVE